MDEPCGPLTVDQEILFLTLAKGFRPVGPFRHFEMAAMLKKFKEMDPVSASSAAVETKHLWNFVNELYNLKALHKLHKIQQEEDGVVDILSARINDGRKTPEFTFEDSDVQDYFIAKHPEMDFSHTSSLQSSSSSLQSIKTTQMTAVEPTQEPLDTMKEKEEKQKEKEKEKGTSNNSTLKRKGIKMELLETATPTPKRKKKELNSLPGSPIQVPAMMVASTPVASTTKSTPRGTRGAQTVTPVTLGPLSRNRPRKTPVSVKEEEVSIKIEKIAESTHDSSTPGSVTKGTPSRSSRSRKK